MESLELRIFKEVAYTKSISRAAENLGYVQPNITAHIKKLETELNTILFIRHNKGVTLTQDGEKLLYQAEKIISLLDQTTEAFKSKSLHIGTTQTIASYLLPKCLIEYQKRFPDRTISVQTYEQNSLNKKLINGQLDCIITNSPYTIAKAKHIYQFQEELVLITPGICQSLDDTKYYPIIVNNIETCPYRITLLNWWNTYHSDLPKIIEIDTVDGILNTVSPGGGISLLPKNLIKSNCTVNTFFLDELQSTSIHIWAAQDKPFIECSVFIDIVKENLIDKIESR